MRQPASSGSPSVLPPAGPPAGGADTDRADTDRADTGGLWRTPPPRRAVAWWAAVLAVMGGTAAGLLRHPLPVALDTIWAEDGAVFLAEATTDSPLAALASSYAGYYHLVPRLLGELAAAAPVSLAAAALALSAAAVTACLAVLVYVASAGHLTSPYPRLLVAAPVVLAPLAQQDVPNSIANLHWPALYAAFWMLVWTPAGRGGRIVAPLVVALTALSDILIIALLPLAVVRLWVRRDRYSGVLVSVLAGCLLVQLAGLFTGASSRELSLDPIQPISGFVLRAVPAAVWGDRWLTGDVLAGSRLVWVTAAWLLVAALLVVALRRPLSRQWPLAVTAGAHSFALYALPVVLTGVATQRYALAPALLLITALVALLQPGSAGQGAARSGRRSLLLARAPLIALTLCFAVVWSLNYRVETEREHGPAWRAEVERAQERCIGSGASTVDVPITPAGSGWHAIVSCDYLLRR